MKTSAPAGTEPLLELRSLSKRFGRVQAVNGVSLDVRPGEVHALLGENGAGKSTLMNLLFGLHRPDEGEIRINGRPVAVHRPSDAISVGVGMVHQHFKLAPALTVAENVALLAGVRLLSRARVRQTAARLAELSEQYGLAVDPQARVANLSVGEQQRVEILKLLVHGADVLILDEPTGVLTPPEWEKLREVLLALRGQGKGIIFISHKMSEVLGLADRCTVMRRGEVVGTWDREHVDGPQLASAMVGRDVEPVVRDATGGDIERVVLSVRDVTVAGRGRPALHDVSLDVRAGEIHGIAGVDGNGQDELIDLILGRLSPSSGEVVLCGQRCSSVPQFLSIGGAVVPADRHRFAAATALSIADNLNVHRIVERTGTRYGIVSRRSNERWADGLVRRFDIRIPGLRAPMSSLSGGNQQKTVLARELDREPAILIAAQPTRGLDVGAVSAVYRALDEYVARGGAVLLISAELDELLTLCDRISVLSHGRLCDPLERSEFDRTVIGLRMAGEAA